MHDTRPQTRVVSGPGFEATLSWTFTSTDSAQVIIHLRSKQGKAFDLVRSVELIPRHPARVQLEGAWIGLSLVEQAQRLALYVSVPQQSGEVRSELLERAAGGQPTPGLKMAMGS